MTCYKSHYNNIVLWSSGSTEIFHRIISSGQEKLCLTEGGGKVKK